MNGKRYTIEYRDEFCVDVIANSEKEAIKKAEESEKWWVCGGGTFGLWRDYIRVYEEETE